MRGTRTVVQYGARAGRTDAPARPAACGRHADTRTSVATQARTGRRATRTAQGNYLLDLPQRHVPRTRGTAEPRSARVPPFGAP
eukprot:3682265-Prymnesium_polylepis.1